jgi:hypothetical protein
VDLRRADLRRAGSVTVLPAASVAAVRAIG